MSAIILIATLAIIVEALIEYGKSIGNAFSSGGWKTAVTQLVAVCVGVFLCIVSGADLFAATEVTFALPYIGMVLTGIIISRGANYVSDFIKRLQGVRAKEE